ncbi:[FeFe] hydrogenase H-cluster maturation GTPase HydF [Ructibacterium gallinarum]|uniref:[FeFe] hydrogenase H-cluster maturation GTPase HydF n=1 Tax=Ructibacterium gallinarum TaxID=2779355 RepID=A0A9D5M2W9_9FIRM|nr:[FeFe] hydrogenase H-cluster maturation GTPase HydF [Ructibacterium gallinarum]MBE5039674.1 [FeFe] hydrogenase H-cluster maturation GTPase HydF [Ructibacterium gallinarum]
MEQTPISMRKHIAIIGKTNAGKSTIFNLLLGQDASIVSDVEGTTTDPVVKAAELIPFGPVALIDTAGFGDKTELGRQRMQKTQQILRRADLILNVIDAGDVTAAEEYKGSVPVIPVYTKCENVSANLLKKYKEENPNAVFLQKDSAEALDSLRKTITERLKEQEKEDNTLIGDLLPVGSRLLLIVPIDSAAPKGRLILPQVQLIRDCLDHHMKAYIVRETEIEEALQELRKIDLAVTDSQAFAIANKSIPPEIPLTSFSMLLARQKGNFEQYLAGAVQIAKLKNNSRVLVLEGCTHNTTHEDIGRVKIPALIQKKVGVKCEYTYCAGYQFPDNFKDFDLVLSCGMCMVNRREVSTRLEKLRDAGIPVVNYGIALAYLNGILERASYIFTHPKK